MNNCKGVYLYTTGFFSKTSTMQLYTIDQHGSPLHCSPCSYMYANTYKVHERCNFDSHRPTNNSCLGYHSAGELLKLLYTSTLLFICLKTSEQLLEVVKVSIGFKNKGVNVIFVCLEEILFGKKLSIHEQYLHIVVNITYTSFTQHNNLLN